MFEFLHMLTRNKLIGGFVYWIGYLYLALLNHIFNKLPFFYVRYVVYKHMYGLKIGNSVLHMGIVMFSPWKVKIGDNVVVHFDAFIDGRGEVEIGDNIDISFGVKIFSEQHDVSSDSYATVSKRVIIKDHAMIGSYSIILPGITIGEGAVVAAGSIVTKDVPNYEVWGGNPAKHIKLRDCKPSYLLSYKRPFH